MSTTEFPEAFTLELRARHFHETEYCSTGRCAIEKAIDDINPKWEAAECFDGLLIKDNDSVIKYQHGDYDEPTFLKDQEISTTHNFDDTIIRTIKMTRA